jgi:Fe-S cluster assembly protein SufB
MKGAKLQYITVQNWSPNVFNLVTKRGLAHEESEIKWIDCNIGSRLTMKYPGVI